VTWLRNQRPALLSISRTWSDKVTVGDNLTRLAFLNNLLIARINEPSSTYLLILCTHCSLEQDYLDLSAKVRQPRATKGIIGVLVQA
jgi:hypothetical protein